MSLKIKILCIAFGLLIVYAAIHGAINRLIFIPGFIYLEQREAEKNLNRPLEALKNEVAHLSALAQDWGAWDETYDFMRSGNPGYRSSNLEPLATYEVNRLNLFVLADTKGRVVWKKALDLDTKKDIRLSDIPDTVLPTGHPFFFEERPGSIRETRSEAGFISTSHGPMMVATRPVLTGTRKGPIRGTLTMGRFLSPGLVKDLSVQTDVPFSVFVPGPGDKAALPELAELMEGSKDRFVDTSDGKILYLYAVVRDIGQKPLFLVKASMGREILVKGLETLRYSMISVVAAGFLLLFLIILILHSSIVNPLSALARHAQDVEETGNLSARLNFQRQDEIGLLARRFDNMLSRLSEVRSELLDQSYYAGLAGIASDILHHSGNILMPMAQKITTLRELCGSVPRKSMHKCLEELEQGVADPERERSLKRLLHLSSLEIGKTFERAEILLDDLERHSREIEQVMGGLERYSRAGKTTRNLVPSELVDEACSRLPEHVRRLCHVRMHPGVRALPPVKGEPLVLGQILVALISHSLAFSGDSAEQNMEIRGGASPGNPAGKMRITVATQGAHLSDDRMTALFDRHSGGDTTHSYQASLHWCSNVVSAMGGELSVSADNTGMAFHLDLPRGGDT